MAEGMTTTNGSGMNSAPTANAPRHPITPRLSALPGKVLRRLQRYYRRYFQNRNHVFVHRGPFLPERRDDCTFVRYQRFDDVPLAVREAIISHGGESVLETDRRELRANATMWAALIDGDLATVLFTRRGRHFRHWFVPLRDDDLVIFRVRTYLSYRGRGLAPSLMRHVFHESVHDGNAAYIDCRVYNRPSIRSIEKAGFERIGTMKPIRREEAIA